MTPTNLFPDFASPIQHCRLIRWCLIERCLQYGWLGAIAIVVGCGDPIHDTAARNITSSSTSLANTGDMDRYEWPLNRERYMVAKPPPMAYLTAFPKKFSEPDPVGAELVPWSNEGLGKEFQDFLRLGYDPPSTELKPTVKLSVDQFHGKNAFDVSHDGSRLIVIDDEGLAMYRTDDGERIGHMELPNAISSSSITAVRFAGKTKDMLVASDAKIYRISSKDGEVNGQVDGCGEPIADWDITPDDQFMLIRSESGRLFGGDTQLNFFGAYDLGIETSFEQASLSPDGKRIGVVVHQHPKTYTIDEFEVVDETLYDQVTLDPGNISIALGTWEDVWADGDGLFVTWPDKDKGRRTSSVHMFWKPLSLAGIQTEDAGSASLIVGRRYSQGKEQLILFANRASYRFSSVPHRIEEVPLRMAANDLGTVVALADSKGLRVVRREAWVPTVMQFPNEWIHDLVNKGRFDEIEKLLTIVKSQQRLAFGRTSEEIRTEIIEAMASRWRWLDKNDPDHKVFKRLKEWRKDGSSLAILCSAVRHFRRGWEERGDGLASTVNKKGWDEYHKRLKLCSKELLQLFEIESEPPLVAFVIRMHAELEQDGDLSTIDPLCKQALELYPGDTQPHDTISFKLLPQWHGEPGDVVSYAMSVSKLMKGRESDLLYARVLGTVCNYVNPRSKLEWQTFDRDKLLRGIDEVHRRKTYTGKELWWLWQQFTFRLRDTEAADHVVEHFMEVLAAPPWHLERDGPKIHQAAQRIRSK